MTTTTDRIEAEPAAAAEPIVFTRAARFAAFDAEYAVTGGDLVVHFFPPPQAREKWWTESFPAVLEEVAVAHFQAGPPRLAAAHVKDFGIDSWWLRARGFGLVLDPDALAAGLLERLDRALGGRRDDGPRP
jgi:hypothetical protein